MKKWCALLVAVSIGGCGGTSSPESGSQVDVRAELVKMANGQNEVAVQQLNRAVTACKNGDKNALNDVVGVTRMTVEKWNKGPGTAQQRDKFNACQAMVADIGKYASICLAAGKADETPYDQRMRGEDAQDCLALLKNPPPLPEAPKQ